MLDLDVSPEEGLQHDNWEFSLGMHFSQAVAILQSQVRVIKSANVIYNDQIPLAHDLILDLPHDGFRLIFDSKTQRLKLIEIYNMKLIRLKYCGTVFNGSDVIPTVHQIDHCFGATRPGTFDKERQLFALNFRGLSFYFPVDSQFEPHYSHGLGSLRFPGESTPILSRMVIYHGSNPAESPVPPIPASVFRGSIYCEQCQVLRNPSSTRTLGLRLKLFSHSTEALDPEHSQVNFEREVRFGDSAQSVAAKLGTPTKVYYKSDDKMKIHSKEAHKKVTRDKSDYFFNYFSLGLDVLFDAGSNQAIKFILHTNFPGHYDFTDYYRCPFSLTLGRADRPGLYEISSSSSSSTTPPSIPTSGGEGDSSPTEKVITSLSAASIGGPQSTNPPPSQMNQGGGKNGNNKKKKNNGNNNNNNKGKNQQNAAAQQESTNKGQTQPSDLQLIGGGGSSGGGNPCTILGKIGHSSSSSSPGHPGERAKSIDINWDTRWDEVRGFLSQDKNERSRLEKPVVLTRSSASNPFGPSLCYGVQDMIFEVMSNDHLASVTLYYFYDEDMPA